MVLSVPEPSSVLTFATLGKRIAEDTSLPAWRRKAVPTSIRCFARLLGLDLETMPVDMRLYQQALARFRPRRAGIDRRRWQNILGDVRFALRYADVDGVPGRNLTRPSPAWATLLALITARGVRYRVARFARWCSERGIAPEDVSESTFADFRSKLELSLVGTARAATTWRHFLRAWQKAAEMLPGWPEVTPRPEPHPRRWTPPLDTFPPSLHHDIESYLAWASRHDPLADDGPTRTLKNTTTQGRRYELRASLGALLVAGRAPQEFRSLADLVEVETAKTALRQLMTRSIPGKTLRAYKIACSLKSIARDWVKVAPTHLEQLGQVCRRLTPKGTGMTSKNRDRLCAFDDPRHVGALLHLPLDLLRQARRQDQGLRKTAVQVQIAVAIEVLLMAPIRIGNLARLHLQDNLSWTRAARAGIVHLVVPGEQVKNGEPLEFELPPETSRLLRTYLEEFRARLVDRPNPFLFPGRNGRPKHDRVLAKQITDTIREHTGLDVHPHLFRHLGAKLHLDANPGQYELIRRVLGHRSVDTTVSFYAGTETAAAVRHFDAQILKLRASTGAARPRLP